MEQVWKDLSKRAKTKRSKSCVPVDIVTDAYLEAVAVRVLAHGGDETCICEAEGKAIRKEE